MTEDADDTARSSDEPLGDLRRDVESRSGETGGEDDTGVRDHFAEMDVDDVDTDEVWADLLFEDEGPTEGQFAPGETTDVPGDVVTKRLCHRCEHFGDPPELHCTHEGTAIRELVDMDHYRVTDCPMVDRDIEER